MINWRKNQRNKIKPLHVQKTQLEYLNIINGDKNLLEDVLIPLLQIISKDESIRIQDMPNKLTKRKGDGIPAVTNNI